MKTKIPTKEKILITQEDYLSLRRAAGILAVLMDAGVEDWVGYNDALKVFTNKNPNLAVLMNEGAEDWTKYNHALKVFTEENPNEDTS